jgi:hypothetical protein
MAHKRCNGKNPEGLPGLISRQLGCGLLVSIARTWLREAAAGDSSRGTSLDDALALTATPRRFRDLLSLLDRRLHVVPSLLQLTQQAFGRQLSLQVFDGSFDPFAVDDDLKGLALY